MDYAKRIAEAVRDAVKDAAHVTVYSGPMVEFEEVDLDAIIASVPLPEPAAYVDLERLSLGSTVATKERSRKSQTKLYAEPVDQVAVATDPALNTKPAVIVVNLKHDLGMTHQYTLDTAEKVIRDGLIALGWTPPGGVKP